MKLETLAIKDLLILKPQVFHDDRGYFYESYNREKLISQGFDVNFVQDNISKSSKHVLRGLHFQNSPFAQAKLVQVLRGAVLDVAVDLRKDSPTFGEHYTIELNEQNNLLFFVPAGFAHGFLTLEDNTIFSYKCSNSYNKESEGSIRWNDPQLGIDWKIKNPIVSDKDKIAPLFSEFKNPF